MGRKQNKYHYIYKTTNVINVNYYIGMHSTDKLDDGYVGSGKRLWHSINYHGKDNFKVEILEYCKNREELSKREELIVNEQLLNEDLCMNLIVGGQGGAGGFKNDEHRIKCQKAGREGVNKALKERFGGDDDWLSKFNSYVSTEAWKNEEYRAQKMKDLDWTGKKHSKETKMKMSETMKGKGKGSTNSQFGKCWITNDIESKKIYRGDAIPEGWRLGRKIK